MIIRSNIGFLSISTTSVTTFVAESQSSVLLAASNPFRSNIVIINDSSKDMWINYDAAATNDHIKISKGSSKDISNVKGAIYGIWAGGATSGAFIIETSYDEN